MRILLRYHGIVGDLIRPRVDAVELHDGATVGDVLDELGRHSEKTAAVLRQANAFVDGQQVKPSTILGDGATVSLMRPIAGGAASSSTSSGPGH